MQKHLSLIDNITHAKVNVIKGHLWFEEFMGGDETIRIEKVWRLLSEAIQALHNAREGKNKTSILKDIPVNDKKLSDQLEQLMVLTHKFREIAKERWKTQDTAGIGSPIDQQFDRVSEDVLHNANVSDTLAHIYISTEITNLRRIHFLILCLWVVTVTGTCIMLYIHNRRRLQMELSIKKLSRAVEYSPCTIIVTNFEGKIEYVNPKFIHLTGYTVNEVIGKNPRILKSGKTSPEVYKQLWRTITSGNEWEGEFCNRKKDGNLYWEYAHISPVKDNNGVISHFVAVKQDFTERKRMEETIRQMALIDTLTSLPNRRLFKDRLTMELAHAQRSNEMLAIMFIDLDRFKEVNDTLGHSAGDKLLQCIAGRLRECVRKNDTVSRFGGDEFNVLLPTVHKTENVVIIAEKIIKIARQPIIIDGIELFITFSIGIALFPCDSEDADTLLKYADCAMYRAKESGRNNYKFYTKDYKNSQNRMTHHLKSRI